MDIETKKSSYSLLSDFGILVNKELRGDFTTIEPPKINIAKVIEDLRKELTNEDIIKQLSSCMNLGLGITEQCNFRCKYCVYSGQYSNERTHSRKKMDFNVAEKSVDLFFQTIMNKNRTKKSHAVYIGFYGGECLLEFELVKKIIESTKSKAISTDLYRRFDLRFRVTTNGYLLDDNTIVDYLVAQNVLLDVSLDGPESEHDKFRVTAKGYKTWAKVMENIRGIKNRYPGYYDSNVNYLVTLHPHHDGTAIDRFFLDHPLLFKKDRLKFNQVNIIGLEKDEVLRLIKTINKPSEIRLEKKFHDLKDKFDFKTRNSMTSYTTTCFPGATKMFVDSDGSIHICEKMTDKAPKIGNVSTGFDFDKIREIVRQYNEEIIKNRCWECECWFLCDVCLAKAYRTEVCRFDCSIKESYPELLKEYLERIETEDEKEYNGCDKSNMIDFIESL